MQTSPSLQAESPHSGISVKKESITFQKVLYYLKATKKYFISGAFHGICDSLVTLTFNICH